MRREREGRNIPWIFFLVFCCSSNVFVRWFWHHICAFSVRLFFKVWAFNFLLSINLPCRGSTRVFTSSHRIANFQTQVVTLLLPVAERNISVSAGSTPMQKILDFHFFLVIFITVVIYLWPASPRWMLKTESFAGQSVAPVDYPLGFSYFLLLTFTRN